MFYTRVSSDIPNVLSALDDVDPSVSYFRGRVSWDTARTLRDGACWGPAVEVCSAPRVVQMGRARPIILIPAPESCSCGERRGFKGK